MALRNSTPTVFKPTGLSDTVDGTNAFKGAMAVLSNLIPANDTGNTWVPRPAAVIASSFTGFTTPGFVSAALVVGDIEFGLIASGLNAGHDQPYAYNLRTSTFLTVSGITAANTPVSPSATGLWTPPIMAVVGTRVVVTHPGFPGGSVKFGWFDVSGFVSNSISVSLNGTTTITSTSNMIQAGFQPGYAISGSFIASNTVIVSVAANGLSAIISQAATGSGSTLLTVAGGSPTAPQWAAGDTNINNLPAVPVSVAQFNGRAYYAVGDGVVFSDSLLALNVTNATQVLTFANGLAVTALGALPLTSPVTGGVVQAIIAFQGVSAMQQITGDQATTNLAVNLLNVATGTLSPLSITPTNFGLAFMSPDGMRIVEFSGQVSDPIGHTGEGVTLPFIYAVQPSRICAAATADVIRISVQNGLLTNQPNQEYWFDIALKVWSGPHTFPASLIQPWQNTFIVHPVGAPGTMWRSDAVPTSSTTYTENGVQLTFQYQTSLMPDNELMCENAMVETAIAVALPGGYSLTLTALAEDGTQINAVTLTSTGVSTLWGAFLWGAAPWAGNVLALRQYRIPWTIPLVFKQASLMMTGQCLGGLKLGNNYFKFERLGYLLQ